MISPSGTGMAMMCQSNAPRCYPIEAVIQAASSLEPGRRIEGMLSFIAPWSPEREKGWQQIRFSLPIQPGMGTCRPPSRPLRPPGQ